jgi:hypothetical protein
VVIIFVNVHRFYVFFLNVSTATATAYVNTIALHQLE